MLTRLSPESPKPLKEDIASIIPFLEIANPNQPKNFDGEARSCCLGYADKSIQRTAERKRRRETLLLHHDVSM